MQGQEGLNMGETMSATVFPSIIAPSPINTAPYFNAVSKLILINIFYILIH